MGHVGVTMCGLRTNHSSRFICFHQAAMKKGKTISFCVLHPAESLCG